MFLFVSVEWFFWTGHTGSFWWWNILDDLLQKWHILEEMSNKEALLFQELVFKKADAEKDEINSKKRSSVTERREAFVPHHILSGVVSAAIKRGNCLVILKTLSASNMPGDVIKINDFKPCYFYQASIKTFCNEEINIENTKDFKVEMKNKIFWKYFKISEYELDNTVELNYTLMILINNHDNDHLKEIELLTRAQQKKLKMV